jgi:hypothetical protein
MIHHFFPRALGQYQRMSQYTPSYAVFMVMSLQQIKPMTCLQTNEALMYLKVAKISG